MLRLTESTTMKPKSFKAGQKVSKKYRRAHRRNLQRQEYERLKAVLPSLAAQSQVDEVEVVEEAINYIDYLHAQIVHRMMKGNLNLQHMLKRMSLPPA